MSVKNFEIGMIIKAIDRVTEPSKKITASIRRMALQSEEATREAHVKGAKHGHEEVVKHAHEHGHEHGKHHGEGFGHGFLEKFSEAVPEIAGAFAIIGGTEGLIEGYKKVTEASDTAATAQLRLSTLMMHNKGTTKEQVKDVSELAEKLEGKSTYAHTIFESGASELAGFGMNAKQIKMLLPSLADYLAKTKGIHASTEDGINAAKLFGKSYSGNVAALRRSGVVFSKAQEYILKHGKAMQRSAVIAQGIQQKFGGLSAKLAGTTEGKVAAMGNTWEAVKEKIGDALKPIREGVVGIVSSWMPAISRFVSWIPGIFKGVGNYFTKYWAAISGGFAKGFGGADTGKLKKGLSGFVPWLKDMWAKALPIIRKAAAWIGELFGKISKWAVTMWNSSQPGIKALIDSWPAISDAISDVWHNAIVPFWNDVLEPLIRWLIVTAVPFLVNVLGPAIKDTFGLIGDSVKTIHGWIDDFDDFFENMGKAFATAWIKVSIGFESFKTDLTKAWKDLWTGLFKWANDEWNGFFDLFKNIGGSFGLGGGDSVGGSVGGGRSQPPQLGGSQIGPIDPHKFAWASTDDSSVHHKHTTHVRVSLDPGLKAHWTHSENQILRGIGGVLP